MYKKLLLTAFALLLCNVLFSQDEWDWNDTPASHDRSYSIAIGPKAGIGIAMGTKPKLLDFDFINGIAYQIGVSANIHFGRRYPQSFGEMGRFGVEAEVIYGVRKLGIEGMNKTMSMQCIEVPFLAQFYPTPSLAIEVGPTFTKILQCGPEQLQLEDVRINTGELLSRDVMFTLGMTYKTPVNLMVDLRYNFGLSTLAGNLDSKVSSWMVSIVYIFKLAGDTIN